MNLEGGRFAVVGGAGFVGSHVVEQLLEAGAAEVRVLDNLVRGSRSNLEAVASDPRLRIVEGSMLQLDTVEDIIDGVDGVFLLAALWLGECNADPKAGVEVNLKGTLNVLQACVKSGVGRVVFSSSASVYGDAVEEPMTEEHPLNNRTVYGATKVAGEHILRAFHDLHGLDYIALRYMNIYGPRMDDRGTYVSVIIKVLQRLAAGEPPLIYGDGSQSYDFVYVTDVARANVLSMEADATDRCYNVGTGHKTSINDLVDALLRETGSGVRPEHRDAGPMFVTNRVGDPTRARDDLGFEARVPLDEGLRSIVSWWNAQKALA